MSARHEITAPLPGHRRFGGRADSTPGRGAAGSATRPRRLFRRLRLGLLRRELRRVDGDLRRTARRARAATDPTDAIIALAIAGAYRRERDELLDRIVGVGG